MVFFSLIRKSFLKSDKLKQMREILHQLDLKDFIPRMKTKKKKTYRQLYRKEIRSSKIKDFIYNANNIRKA